MNRLLIIPFFRLRSLLPPPPWFRLWLLLLLSLAFFCLLLLFVLLRFLLLPVTDGGGGGATVVVVDLRWCLVVTSSALEPLLLRLCFLLPAPPLCLLVPLRWPPEPPPPRPETEAKVAFTWPDLTRFLATFTAGISGSSANKTIGLSKPNNNK